MNINDRVKVFQTLRERLETLTEKELAALTRGALQSNGWFTKNNVKEALVGIIYMLQEEKLSKWLENYELKEPVPKIVGIIMAGNIPLVGFHDLLCVLIVGHSATIKPSSSDAFLVHTIVQWIYEIESGFKKKIEIRDQLGKTDAVIATGSDSTARHFEYYFKHIPHIIRKNRTSVAIISGEETPEDLGNLGKDIFSYFGLGCRNISKIFIPEGYDLTTMFPYFESFKNVMDHHKYRNNYDYHKAIYLVNKTPHLDTGFLLVTSTDDLVSPISALYHQQYDSLENLKKMQDQQKNKIQCKIGKEHTPFGYSQRPELWDYADNVDVIEFLSNL